MVFTELCLQTCFADLGTHHDDEKIFYAVAVATLINNRDRGDACCLGYGVSRAGRTAYR